MDSHSSTPFSLQQSSNVAVKDILQSPGIVKRRFPGPAGLLPNISERNFLVQHAATSEQNEVNFSNINLDEFYLDCFRIFCYVHSKHIHCLRMDLGRK